MKKNLIALVAVAACGAAVGAIPASLYVQDNLLAHWDAVDNAGVGVHDSTATSWANLVAGSSVGSLNLSTLPSYSWNDNYLTMQSGPAKSPEKQLVTTEDVDLGGKFSIEVMAYATDGIVRRWEAVPWTSSFESWTSDTEGYLERIVDTRFTAQAKLVKNETLAFTTIYNGSRHSQYIRRADGSVVDQGKDKSGFTFKGKMAFLSQLAGGGRGYSVRVYTNALSEVERAYNSALDQIRFEDRAPTAVVLPKGWRMDDMLNLLDQNGTTLRASGIATFVWTGAAETGLWSDAGNWSDSNGAAVTRAPSLADVATLGDAAEVTVDADATVLRLVVATGARIAVAADKTLCASEVLAGGTSVKRSILSCDAAKGWTVDWMTGLGVVRVAGGLNRTFPVHYKAPAADGWYEFGLKSGYTLSEKAGFNGPTDKTTRPFAQAEKIDWSQYVFPSGAEVRLVGGVLMNAIPADTFAEVDVSGLKQLTLYAPSAFADGSVLAVPGGVTCRYSPGTWEFHSASNGWYQTVVAGQAFEGDISLSETTWKVSGNGTHYSSQVFNGSFSGTGTISLDNFSNHATFNGPFAFSGSVNFGSDQGGSLRIYSPTVSGELSSVSMAACTGQFATNSQYVATLLVYGPKSGSSTTPGELKITTLTGRASNAVYDTRGVHVRNGGILLVWGGNTVHVGELKEGVHLVARGQDQYCVNDKVNEIATFGTGNVIFDKISSGNVYGSTNVNVTVGSVNAATVFDYTYQSGAINMMTLDVTGSCNAGAKVTATDLAMLPARLSGFKGTVNLTDTATKAYPVTLDLAKGLAGVYNRGGCAGSGTLGSVPASGTINLAISAGDAPEKGEYGIARFTSGGEKLAGWTVNVAGHEGESQFMIGSGENQKVATLVRDATGLWLKVTNPGLQVFLR